jgi:hypothetical protein
MNIVGFVVFFGLKHNQYSLGLIDNSLTMDALFERGVTVRFVLESPIIFFQKKNSV